MPLPERVLLTGFEPFGGDGINPSQEVVRRLQGWRSASGAVVEASVLPTVFGRSVDVLVEAIERVQPCLVIALGLAASRREISVERVAINCDDARLPDNAGVQPIDRPVMPGGPAAYFSTLPIKAIVSALQAVHIPAAVSQTAGTFVCNHLFYGLAHVLTTRWPTVRGGFIHLPPMQTKGVSVFAKTVAATQEGLTLETMLLATRIAIDTALAVRKDVRWSAGTID